VGGLMVTMNGGGLTWDPDGQQAWLVGDFYGGDAVYTVDLQTGAATLVANLVLFYGPTSAAWDTSTDTLYVLEFGGQLFSVDPATGAETPIGMTSGGMQAIAYDALGDRLLGIDGSGTVAEVDRATGYSGSIVFLPLTTPSLSDVGLTWDPATNSLWVSSTTEPFYGIDLLGSYDFSPVPTPTGDYDALTYVTARTAAHIGSYDVSDGPLWTTNPPVYSCRQGCVQVFGGSATDYQCSTQLTSIDHLAWASGWGDPTFCFATVSETFSQDQGGGYDCGYVGCSYSAYVADQCFNAVNHCWR